MTAQELLLQQLEDAGNQISRFCEGASEAVLDHRNTPNAMTAREQIEHLCECYQAYAMHAAGTKYKWGTYQAKSTATASLLNELAEQRAKAVQLVQNDASDENLKQAHMYVLAHDYYHVGQMCQARLAVQPDWDPYAIYGL